MCVCRSIFRVFVLFSFYIFIITSFFPFLLFLYTNILLSSCIYCYFLLCYIISYIRQKNCSNYYTTTTTIRKHNNDGYVTYLCVFVVCVCVVCGVIPRQIGANMQEMYTLLFLLIPHMFFIHFHKENSLILFRNNNNN